MFHGDIVEMTSNAVVVREKALQPVGIYDQSICWGLWAADPHEQRDRRPNPHYRHPNLIISPFHPSSWPFLVHIRLILENRKGALTEASRLLEKNDLSILFAECTPTGFTHATWTVIAESTRRELEELRRRKQQFDWDYQTVRVPPTKEYDEARDLANLIAAHMLTHVRALEEVFIRLKHDPAPSPLLHGWRAEGNSHFLYNGNAVAGEMPGSPETNLEYINSQIPNPATVSYMQRLAYFALYGGGKYLEVPFNFKYEAKDRIIKMLSPINFESGTFKLAPLPLPAFGTFNSEEKYLRLCPVTPGFLERSRLSHIIVPYKVERQEIYNAKSSQGLLRLVCGELQAADVDLLQLSNKWTSHAYHDEAGILSFIADVAPGKYVEVRKKLEAINADRPEHLKQVTLGNITLTNYPQKKLYLSIRLGERHPRERNIRELVKKISAEEGFIDVVTVETYSGSALEAVKSEMKECHAFLQVLYVDADKSHEEMNFRWLEKEYDLASNLGLRILQLVDVVRVPLDWWRTRDICAPPQYAKAFRTDVCDDKLSGDIREAVIELARKLQLQPRGDEQ